MVGARDPGKYAFTMIGPKPMASDILIEPTGSSRPDVDLESPRRRIRMAPSDRIDMILDGAVEFFAEHGFNAQTRELARGLGVSQSLIYHYFLTKDDLIDKVYERNFLSRWRTDWEEILSDRERPIVDRLKTFYLSYLTVIDETNWIRIVMFSGLDGSNLTRRYIDTQISRILRVIAIELRQGLAGDANDHAPDEAELERVWHLHSTFIYYLVRKHIFKIAALSDRKRLVDIVVDNFLHGVGHVKP